MIENIIKVIVAAVVLYIVWILLSTVLIFLPSMVLKLIGIVLVLVFCAFMLRVFGISF